MWSSCDKCRYLHPLIFCAASKTADPFMGTCTHLHGLLVAITSLMSVAIDAGGSNFFARVPRPSFKRENAVGLFDVTTTPFSVTAAAGERFLVPVLANVAQASIHVSLNRPARLKNLHSEYSYYRFEHPEPLCNCKRSLRTE